MTHDDDDGGASDILASFRSPRSESPPPMLLSFDDEGSDGMATPRAVRRQHMSHSQSAPSFPSLENDSRNKLAPSTSSSSGNLSAMAGTGRSITEQQGSHCTTCRRACSQPEIQRAGDGQTFCRPCYADRFLPKCRKCKLPIEGGAVASSDGKVLGKVRRVLASANSGLAGLTISARSTTPAASRASRAPLRSQTESSTSCEPSPRALVR